MGAYTANNSSSSSSINRVIVISLSLLIFFMGTSSAQLSTKFYAKRCPKLLSTVRSAVQSAIAKERRMGASLLRLHFHDCFVNGCDASVLLDDTATFTGEQTARPNNNSIRGLDVIDGIKAKVEKVCSGIVSCADIITLAARDSVVILGGPNWKVKLGRRDARTASFSAANSGVIPPPTSTLQNLINRFKARGLSARDMVALSGAHSIGKAQCVTFRNRIYNERNIDKSFAKTRQRNCPRSTNSGNNNLAPLDFQTPNHFDNLYYKHLLTKKGLLHSDQVLYNGGSTDSLVEKYSKNDKIFDSDFVTAMIKMGNIKPLTGSKGEIRKKCGRVN